MTSVSLGIWNWKERGVKHLCLPVTGGTLRENEKTLIKKILVKILSAR